MLLKLFIENYALIDKLEIEFSDGLTVITGETGAGKSILVGALSLILGGRADTTVLTDPGRKCIVEGLVQLSRYEGLREFFSNNDIDYDDHTVIRREIAPGGKSRAFINDTPVSVSQLKELGEQLVNIHSQHSVITLNDPSFQLAVVDDYARNQQDLVKYRDLFRDYTEQGRILAGLLETEKKSKAEQDYYQFVLDELEKANLVEGEQEELEQQQEVLAHAGEIKSCLLRSIQELSGEEVSLLSVLSGIINALGTVSGYRNDIKVIVERLKSNQIDIKDILSEIEHIEPTISFDQAESDATSSRLDLIYRLEKKHLVQSVGELITVREDIAARLGKTIRMGEQIVELEKKMAQEEAELKSLARGISGKRTAAIPPLEKEMVRLLTLLGMPFARFSVMIEQGDVLKKDGFDRVKFLFSANKGVELNDLSKVASGGELSRLMLSIKSLLTRKNLLPTVIFDEIDSGISGEIAGKVGSIMKNMSKHMQVIVITHLPQIAGKGDSHLWVYKKDSTDVTRSMIRKLTDGERVKEIARMLSSEKVTEAAVMTARELLKD